MKNKPSERQEYWRVVVGEQEASGKAIREFCRERKLTEHAFYWWRQHLRKEQPLSFSLVETKPTAPAAQFELRLSSGEVLHISTDVQSLRVVFEALRTAR